MNVEEGLANFVHYVFHDWGNCTGYCEMCKESHPACGGEKYENGECPDGCDGCSEDFFSVATDYKGRQVGECCWEKIFGPIKKMMDERRFGILNYYKEAVGNEIKMLVKEEQLLNEVML